MNAIDVATDGQDVTVTRDGRVLTRGPLSEACSTAFATAIDACDETHGAIAIGAGRFPLTAPIVVDRRIVVSGEGSATRLIPPPGEFALKVMATERSPLRRDIIRDADAALHAMEIRTFGIQIANLAIDGEGHGRGIYAEFLIEGLFRDLSIHRMGGAGIMLGPSVMETVFETIHLLDCGAGGEPAIAIAAQPAGDAGNNIVFDKLFNIFPNGVGLEIGSGEGGEKPRLITLRDCMFHGWLPVERAVAAPLVLVRRMDGKRGLRILGGRFTNTAVDRPLIELAEGETHVASAIFGGGGGSCSLLTRTGTAVFVSDCTFHGTRGKDGPGDIAHAGGTFVFRGNSAVGNHGRIVLGEDARAVIEANVFDRLQPGRPIVLGATANRTRFRDNIVKNAAGKIAPGLDEAAVAADNLLQ